MVRVKNILYKNKFLLLYLSFLALLPISALALANCSGGDLICNPLGSQSLSGLIKSIAKMVVQIGASVAVIFIIYSGFKFVTARGNAKELEDAKKTFYWTMIGTAILLGAYVIAEGIQSTIEGFK